MKITLRRDAFNTNVHQALGPVDTTADVESGMLEALMMGWDFFALPERYPDTGVNDPEYLTVEVDDGKRSHSVTWETGSDIPDALRDLFTATAKVASDHNDEWRDAPIRTR